MCTYFEGVKDPKHYLEFFKATLPNEALAEVWPGYLSSFIRRPLEANSRDEAVPEREGLTGMFGLVPWWAKDTKLAKRTYNARSETVAVKPSYRDAWKKSQHCIVPAQAIYELDWRTGRAVPTRIERADDKPMGIAGLWEWTRMPQGDGLFSFTLLTINADQHTLMRNFHRPDDEKRMVVILPEGSFGDWLGASVTESSEFLNQFPADALVATPGVPRVKKARVTVTSSTTKEKEEMAEGDSRTLSLF